MNASGKVEHVLGRHVAGNGEEMARLPLSQFSPMLAVVALLFCLSLVLSALLLLTTTTTTCCWRNQLIQVTAKVVVFLSSARDKAICPTPPL